MAVLFAFYLPFADFVSKLYCPSRTLKEKMAVPSPPPPHEFHPPLPSKPNLPFVALVSEFLDLHATPPVNLSFAHSYQDFFSALSISQFRLNSHTSLSMKIQGLGLIESCPCLITQKRRPSDFFVHPAGSSECGSPTVGFYAGTVPI